MKSILLVLIVFFSLNEMAYSKVSFIEDSWHNSFESSGPSCALYRKRVANYYQRIAEVYNVSKAMNGTFDVREVERMLDLWKRTGIPLALDSIATYKVSYRIEEEDKKFFEAQNSVEVTSALFNWVSDKFIFPETIMRVTLFPQNILDIEVDLTYSQACLTKFSLGLDVKSADGEVLALDMFLDKYKWDVEN